MALLGTVSVICLAEATSPLGHQMLRLAGDLKQIQTTITDATKNPDNLKLAQYMEDAAKQSRALIPGGAATAPYQAAIDSLITEIQGLENAFANGKNDQAQLAVNQIIATRNQGHKDFKPPHP